MKTEAEAKKCWCPFARVVFAHSEIGVVGIAAGNRGWSIPKSELSLGGSATRCIASECMAWRTVERRGPPPLTGAEPGRGYCGLAGKP